MIRAATISKAEGDVTVARGGQDIILKQGDVLYESDTIKTTTHSVELSFADGSVATLGPQTVMSIQDFAFGTQEEPSFVVDLAVGAMRTISGKVVEQNPDAFKLLTPSATVGIRGTTLDTFVTPDGAMGCALVHISQGHYLVVTAHAGEQSLLNAVGQIVSITPDGQAVVRTATPEELQDFMKSVEELQDFLNTPASEDEERQGTQDADDDLNSDQDEQNRQDEETNSGETDANLLLVEQLQAVLGDLDFAEEVSTAIVADISTDVPLTTESDEGFYEEAQNTDTDTDSDSDSGTETSGGTGGSGGSGSGYTKVATAGDDYFYADGAHSSTDVHATSHDITIEGNIDTDIYISGDVYDVLSGVTVIGADDILTGKNMSNGTLVGDAYLVEEGGNLMGGNDIISVQQKTGGQSIYGDIKEFVLSTEMSSFGDNKNHGALSFGNDKITVEGDLVNANVGGDLGYIENYFGATVPVEKWGDDHITVKGNLGNGLADADIYGDYGGGSKILTNESRGGHDNISVHGTMHLNALIRGGVGNDTITVNDLHGGEIYGDESVYVHYGHEPISGDDTITVTTFTRGTIYANEGADTINITHAAAEHEMSLLDVGDDDAMDGIYLANGSGYLRILNFNSDMDKIFVGGQEQDFRGDDTYGDYTLVFGPASDNTAPQFTSNPQTLELPFGAAGMDGSVVATDADNDTLTFSVKVGAEPKYGTMIFSDEAAGAFDYRVDSSKYPSILPDTLTDTFTIIVSDGKGGTAEQQMTVNIVTNDPQTIVIPQFIYDSFVENEVLSDPGAPTNTYGNTKLTLQASLDRNIFITGDASDVTTGGTGGADQVTIEFNVNNGLIVGDAIAVQAGGSAFVVGHDNISVRGTVAEGAVIVGDADFVNLTDGSTMTLRGNDSFSLGSGGGDFTGGTIYGDVRTVTSGVIDSVGHDTLHISGNMLGGSVYGDVGSVTGTGHNIGGDDSIRIDGAMTAGNISLDSHASDMVNNTFFGDDRLEIQGGMTGGSIRATHGTDVINISGGSAPNVVQISLDAAQNSTLLLNVAGTASDTVNFAFTNTPTDVTVYLSGTIAQMGTVTLNTTTLSSSPTTIDGVTFVFSTLQAGDVTSPLHLGTGDSAITITGSVTNGADIFGDAEVLESGYEVGNDAIVVGNGMDTARIFGDTLTFDAGFGTANDIIIVTGNIQSATISGDVHTVSGSATMTGSDTILIEGGMTDSHIYGDAVITTGATGTLGGNDNITVTGVMYGGTIDGGAGDDKITVGGIGLGALIGTIKGGAGLDQVSVFVGDTTQNNLFIDAEGMGFSGESINLYDGGVSSVQSIVHITGLDNAGRYQAGSFTAGGEDITSRVNEALVNNETSITHGVFDIYFTS